MSEQDLRDELLTLLTDGPTSTSLAWTFERLLRNPDKLELAREDVRGGDGTYLDAVIKETLRLRPPVPVVVRRLLEPMELGGYELPAGTTVAPCIHLIHRNEEIYPEAEALPPRALPRPPARHLHLDPVRRRHPPLPRRQLRRNGDEAGAAHGLRRGRPAAGREPLRADAQKRDLLQPRPPRTGDRASRARPCRSRAPDRPADRRRRRQGGRDRDQGPRRSTGSASGRSRLKIVEGTEPAASWLGRNGMTSGEEPLAVTPIKDIGFPYQSH